MRNARAVTEEVELDLGRYELRRFGRRVKLEKKSMELLILLVSRREQLVSREAVVTRLWGSYLFIGTDRNINNIVRKLRTALGDKSAKPRFLETVLVQAGTTRVSALALPMRWSQEWETCGAWTCCRPLRCSMYGPTRALPIPLHDWVSALSSTVHFNSRRERGVSLSQCSTPICRELASRAGAISTSLASPTLRMRLPGKSPAH